MVSSPSARRRSASIVYHVRSHSLPKESVLENESGILVCSPELTLLQAAERLDFINLVELMIEFCGSYDPISPLAAECFPLTTKEKLKEYCESAVGVPGRRNALRALRYIADGSASPRETICLMLLCLPRKVGGYGLPLPELNYRIDIHLKCRQRAGKMYYRGDMVWPDKKVDLEYDSDQEHTGSRRIAQDAIRRSVLVEMGYTVETMGKLQLDGARETHELALRLARLLGCRVRYNPDVFEVARAYLRTRLLRDSLTERIARSF